MEPSKEQYELIIDKFKSKPQLDFINLVHCFDSVVKRKPSNKELETLLIYLNKEYIPQA